MRKTQTGESLWIEWDGTEIPGLDLDHTIFFTYGSVDLENEIVARALAVAIQRTGEAESLAEAFRLVERATSLQGHAGYLEDDREISACSEDGETEDGDLVPQPEAVTWVEIPDIGS